MIFRHLLDLRWLYTWLSRRLQHRRLIVRLFLLLLFLVAGLGFAGSFPTDLDGISGGSTSLAYRLAQHRNQREIQQGTPPKWYQLRTTPDIEMQQYFDLDAQTGILSLRDGMQTISTQMNPLKLFPLRIDKLDKDGMPIPGKGIGLYVRVIGEPKAVIFRPPSEGHSNVSASPRLDTRRHEEAGSQASGLCIRDLIPLGGVSLDGVSLDGIVRKVSSKACIDEFLKGKDAIGRTAGILLPQEQRILRSLYKQELEDVWRLPVIQPPETSSAGPKEDQLPGMYFDIIIPKEKAMPGIQVFDSLCPGSVPNGHNHKKLPCNEKEDKNIKTNAKAKESRAGESGRSSTMQDKLLGLASRLVLLVNGWVIAALQLRVPTLIIGGLLLPGLIYAVRPRSCINHYALEPYLLLLGAQVVTMVVAQSLLGEGLVIWVGLIYTWLRVVQLMGLLGFSAPALWMRQAMLGPASQEIDPSILLQNDLYRTGGNIMTPRQQSLWRRVRLTPGARTLVTVLWFELLLWSVNGFGLLWHVISVFVHWNDISPA